MKNEKLTGFFREARRLAELSRKRVVSALPEFSYNDEKKTWTIVAGVPDAVLEI